MKYEKLFILILILLVIPLISSQLVFKQGDKIDLKLPCSFNGTICDTSAKCNATVLYPNGSFAIENINMTNKGNGMPNATLPNANVTGTYTARYTCSQSGHADSETFSILVNPAGEELSTSNAILYLFFLVLLLLVFGLTIYGAFRLPWRNTLDESGKVLSVTDLKWVKMFCIVMIYIESIFISTIVYELTNGYLLLEGISGLFYVINRVLFATLIPFGVIFAWIVILIVFQDKKMKKLIQRGIPMR